MIARRVGARLLTSLLGSLLVLVLAAPAARAQTGKVAADASRRFQRGVQLYNEGDFRGAVVEFRKAHTMLPRASALYNIGQTEYQLREYASALRTLERFLIETGPKAPHHAEVRETVELLRDRVGHVQLTSDRASCEVTVDDQTVGTTPLTEPLLVSMGRRRVAVTCAGGQRVAREVEVAGRETVQVRLELGPPLLAAPATLSGPARPPGRPALRVPARPPRRPTRVGPLAWAGSAVLVAATAGAYSAAALGSRQLLHLRNSYPVTLDQLQYRARVNRRLAVAGDILAASSLIAVALTTYLSVSGRSPSGEGDEAAANSAGAVFTAGGFGLLATF
jgi:tetratricopeptide (TPR) repeat protein